MKAEDTTETSLEEGRSVRVEMTLDDGADGALVQMLKASGRKPRAAMLVIIWDDDVEVGLRLPDEPEEALRALRQLKVAARESSDCFLKPRRCNA